MASWIRSTLGRIRASRFSTDVIWLTALSGIERVAAVIQTVLVARALGISEYGVYGLLFGTLGFVASVAGLQMGLTATVYIAKYRQHEKAKVALVIQYVTRFAFFVAISFVVLTIPFADQLSTWLLNSEKYAATLVLGCVFVGATLLSGTQDGILQGFEDFKSLAKARILTSFLTVIAVYPAAIVFGVAGVVFAVLSGVIIKYALLYFAVKKHKCINEIPESGSGLRYADVIFRFSLPSVFINLLVGAVAWLGTFLLSRQHGGFESLAIVNIGLQWRGPVLLLAASLGSVAIPAFSRYAEQENSLASSRLQRKMLWLNCAIAAGFSTALVLISTPLLGLYGHAFEGGRLIFSLLVASTVPQVLVNVYMQNFVGQGQLWRVLTMHTPFLFMSMVGYVTLVPKYGAMGFAATTLASSSMFWLYLIAISGKKKWGGL